MNIYERAIAHLEDMAFALRSAYCIGADWLGNTEAKAEHDDLLEVAQGLRELAGENS